MNDLTPRQIVEKLNQDIIGQADAKRAVAVAVRNRWRRQQTVRRRFTRRLSEEHSHDRPDGRR